MPDKKAEAKKSGPNTGRSTTGQFTKRSGQPANKPVGTLTQHTPATTALLDDIRNGHLAGANANLGDAGGSSGQDLSGTISASGTGSGPNGQNHAARPGDDFGARSATGTIDRFNGSAGIGNGSADQGQRELERDRGSASRPRGLVAEPLPQKLLPPPKKPDAKDQAKRHWTLPGIENATALTVQEAEAIRANLEFGLRTILQAMDDAITHSNKAHAVSTIWVMDDEDIAFLVQEMLAAGLRIPAAAVAVRALANSVNQLKVGAILLPRFVQTWNHYATNGIGVWM